MEYGMVPKLDQFTENQAREIQRVQTSSQSSEVKTRQNLENIQQDVANSKKNSDIQKAQNESTPQQKYEVLLTNTNFGFNNTSRDFFVKVKRGDAENQYPTESMMKAKAHMLSLQNEGIKVED